MIPRAFDERYDPPPDDSEELDRRDARREPPIRLGQEGQARAEEWFRPILERFQALKR